MMKISLFTPAIDQNQKRYYLFFKSINLDYSLSVGSFYMDTENQKVYAIKAIFFKEEQIVAIVQEQGEERFWDFGSLF